MAIVNFGEAKFCEECSSKFSDVEVCPHCKGKGIPKPKKVEGKSK